MKQVQRTLQRAFTLTIIALNYLQVAYAAAPSIGCGETAPGETGVLPGCTNPSVDAAEQGRTFLTSTLPGLINWGVAILGLVAMAFLVKGGFMFITSLGAEDKMKSAIKTIVAALVGLFIVTISYILVTVATNFSFFN